MQRQRLVCGLAVVAFAALASGCYVAPPYSYVRGTTYAGSAYYGEGPAVVYRSSYYDYPYASYYGGYGCCWASGVTVGGVWYRGGHGHRDYDGDRRGGGWHGNGHWQRRDGDGDGGRGRGRGRHGGWNGDQH